jgi:hypothetical protein
MQKDIGAGFVPNKRVFVLSNFLSSLEHGTHDKAVAGFI